MREVEVYLSFADIVTNREREEFLKALKASMSASMSLIVQHGEASVHFVHSDPTAAVVAVQQRAKPICEQLGLTAEQVTWSLEPPHHRSSERSRHDEQR